MNKNLYTPKHIRTFTGEYVNIFDPDPAKIKIQDIAHALSQQCRFGGHLPFMYTVAQHAVECSNHIAEQYKFAALMHDASEAYLMDLPRPIKNELPRYKQIENNLLQIIADKFGFPYPLPSPVKAIDTMLLKIEWQQMMVDHNPGYFGPTFNNIVLSQPMIAKQNFLSSFFELNQKLRIDQTHNSLPWNSQKICLNCLPAMATSANRSMKSPKKKAMP